MKKPKSPKPKRKKRAEHQVDIEQMAGMRHDEPEVERVGPIQRRDARRAARRGGA